MYRAPLPRDLTAVLLALILTACGGGGGAPDAGGPGDAGGLGDAGGAGDDASAPDAGPSDAGCAPATVLAVSQLQWGEGSSGEWQGYGFDLDGRVSTAASTDVCQPSSGGSAAVAYPDGTAGIDNSFGKNILPVLLALSPSFAADTNASLDSGGFTTLLELMCLPPEGDVPVLAARLFDGLPLGAAPAWDGTDVWPIDPWLLSDAGDPTSSTALFPASSVTGTAFDAGTGGTFVLTIPISASGSSTFVRLTIRAARVTMTLSGDRTSATAGRIGGVLDTEELVAELEKVGVLLGICGSPIYDSFVTQVRQASDILADGTQDPATTCNGISIGLGFEMSPAQRGDVGTTRPAGPTCP